MRKLLAKLLTCWVPAQARRKRWRKAILYKIAKKTYVNNEAIIEKIPPYNGSKKTLLFVFPDRFHHTGGKETRMLYFFEALQKRGYRIIIIAPKASVNEELIAKYSPYLLSFGNIHSFNDHYQINDHITDEIIQIAAKEQASLIEFNLCSRQHSNIDYQKISNIVPLGFHYHEAPPAEFHETLAKYHIVNSHKNMHDSPLFHVIVNPVDDHTARQQYQYNHQTRALLISRLSSDKMDVIIPALEFFRKHNMDFDIAGPIDHRNRKIVKKLRRKFDLRPKQFIGKIETTDFLSQNIHQYLFVAGVGQVVLEAGSMGYPILLSVKDGKAYFIEQQHFDHYRFCNLTKPDVDLPIDADQQLKDVLHGENTHQYDLMQPIKEHYSMSVVLEQYIRIIETV